VRQPHFSRTNSELVSIFLTRLPEAESALKALDGLIVRLRESLNNGSPIASLDRYITARNIREFTYSHEVDTHGKLIPLGSSFDDGFSMIIRRELSPLRLRFAIAHEICHTFFYELVPEVKFQPHPRDAQEEFLCNAGAASILMPENQLRVDARGTSPSFSDLERLASLYEVSIWAMFMRLQSLGLWQAEMSTWHRFEDGQFAQDKLLSKKRGEWKWYSQQGLEKAWRGGSESVSGREWIFLNDADGTRAKLVYYEMRRRNNQVFTIWRAKPQDRKPVASASLSLKGLSSKKRQNSSS
jgi:Zn-dependent peptidase ImmA (M78 family)